MKKFILVMLLIIGGLTTLAVVMHVQGKEKFATVEPCFSVEEVDCEEGIGRMIQRIENLTTAFNNPKLILQQDLMNALRADGWYVERHWEDIWGEDPSLHLTFLIEHDNTPESIGYSKLSIGIGSYPGCLEDYSVQDFFSAWLGNSYRHDRLVGCPTVRNLSLEQWEELMKKHNKFFIDDLRGKAEFETQYGGTPIVNIDYTMYGWYFIAGINYGQIIIKRGYPLEIDWD